MMKDYVASTNPTFSVVVMATLIAIAVLAFARGYLYKEVIKNRTLQGLIGLAEAVAMSAVVIVVMLYEHYAGLVQVIINFLAPNNGADSPVWADFIALGGIAGFACFCGLGYNAIKKAAYKLHKKAARESVQM